MKFHGYWVLTRANEVCIERTTFDETELDPATDWKQAWQNQDCDGSVKGYVELDAAFISAAMFLAKVEGRLLGQAEADQARQFDPSWQGNRCDITSLSQLLSSKSG